MGDIVEFTVIFSKTNNRQQTHKGLVVKVKNPNRLNYCVWVIFIYGGS